MYRPLYAADHSFVRISVSASQPNARLEKGLREWMLCAACEARFSKWEDYGARFLDCRAAIGKKSLSVGLR